jgi:hypothetical protein
MQLIGRGGGGPKHVEYLEKLRWSILDAIMQPAMLKVASVVLEFFDPGFQIERQVKPRR